MPTTCTARELELELQSLFGKLYHVDCMTNRMLIDIGSMAAGTLWERRPHTILLDSSMQVKRTVVKVSSL